ncbi:unnamed protein product [Orchesella dallaii]|uniref:Fibronectin type III domain-containing protein n=1 Tax=Orchesella dallaii TaxID=48710 RepID=A0ABP1Q3D4_9HEXA
MAPSERSSPEISRYLTSSSEQKESPPGAEEGLEAEHFISGEEWDHHRTVEERPDMEKLHDHGDGESHNSNGDHRLPHLPRRTPRNKSTNSNNNSTFPELKYVKGEILPPTSLASEQQRHQYSPPASGDSVYMSPKATSQYQAHPDQSDNNGVSANGNYHSNNGAHHPRPYPNGGGHPIPPHPNYPYHHYPQSAGYPYYHDPHGQYVISNTTSGGLDDVRGEEVGIVIVVLLLWVGAIILFFNRWGKIRMLEPYQPKFCENHRPSCPMAEVTTGNHPVCNERAFSKFNLSTEMLASPHFVKCNYHGIPASDPIPGFSGISTTMMPGGGLAIPGAGFPTGGSTGMLSNHRNSFMMNHQHHHRPRQNSVFVTSPSSQVSFYGSDTTLKNMSRKTKSAVDLPTLVLSGEFVDNARRNSKSSITQL